MSNLSIHLHIQPSKFYYIIFQGKAYVSQKSSIPIPKVTGRKQKFIP